MKYSSLFGKTTRGDQSGSTIKSHQLLVRGGFIRESVAGRYFFLPLGWRVHQKMAAVIKKHMDATGAQEMITPTLHPLELWEETNRTSTTGFELMKVEDRRGGKFALGGTAEEMMVDVVRKFQISYRDLPFNVYQFSTKFRDEQRARGGLLRVREFVMKDAYSFHATAEDFQKEYETMRNTYTAIFQEFNLDTHVVEADNGYIGGDYCHEFQAESDVGEDCFFVTDDGQYAANDDIASFAFTPMNADEDTRAFEIIEQPRWVRTMEENIKHYGEPQWRYLKNVVYRTIEGDVVISSIRGDLDVNKIKLERLLDLVGQLEEATDEDLKAIGTKSGYVHCWGHDFITERRAATQDRACRVIYVADESLKTVKNFIGGQKEDATDSSNVNYGRDFKHEIEGDVAMAYDGAIREDGQVLRAKTGIEVGNIFSLGTHYSAKMSGAAYHDSDGVEKPFYMGCYGIGIGRTLAAIVEKDNDDRGILWPESIAPFRVHLVSLPGVQDEAAALYQQLSDAGVEVLWDDRDERPGVKFGDADLIGCPWRVVISAKSLKAGGVELKRRSEKDAPIVPIAGLESRFEN
ncbi:MAG TPA: proline--tRNA ligase [Pseudomonadales bacterium]|jgi:prolyl-tRNA synthetase|nr:proline--tRNA ligase [Pseudomonadales bacterium]|tara:strand:- start:1938 stop:3665 length:1728 start_codon:yes stop_codon:yes gene_type:complete